LGFGLADNLILIGFGRLCALFLCSAPPEGQWFILPIWATGPKPRKREAGRNQPKAGQYMGRQVRKHRTFATRFSDNGKLSDVLDKPNESLLSKLPD
jgi:hypothetical protein